MRSKQIQYPRKFNKTCHVVYNPPVDSILIQKVARRRMELKRESKFVRLCECLYVVLCEYMCLCLYIGIGGSHFVHKVAKKKFCLWCDLYHRTCSLYVYVYVHVRIIVFLRRRRIVLFIAFNSTITSRKDFTFLFCFRTVSGAWKWWNRTRLMRIEPYEKQKLFNYKIYFITLNKNKIMKASREFSLLPLNIFRETFHSFPLFSIHPLILFLSTFLCLYFSCKTTKKDCFIVILKYRL